MEFLNLPDRIDLLKQRTDITNIFSGALIGNTSTIQFIKVVDDSDPNDNKWLNGEPENFSQDESAFAMGQGDGTVPYDSANSLNGVNVIEAADDGHNVLPTTRQQDIIEILTGERPENYYDNETLYTVKRWFFTAVFSPADLQIIAPDGRQVGKDFATGQTINEIEGAFYTGFGAGVEPEFVIIPEPMAGEYQIKLQGDSNGGGYQLFAGIINEDNLIENQEFLIESAIMAAGEDGFILDYAPNASTPVYFESEVDFDKLLALTGSLYGANEIKKESVYHYLTNNFESLKRQTERFGRLRNQNLSQVLANLVELRLRLMLEELDFYLRKDWLNTQAYEILKSNINLLINKL